jgi:hypothetical protein
MYLTVVWSRHGELPNVKDYIYEGGNARKGVNLVKKNVSISPRLPELGATEPGPQQQRLLLLTHIVRR